MGSRGVKLRGRGLHGIWLEWIHKSRQKEQTSRIKLE
jgi:hypothetical protein